MIILLPEQHVIVWSLREDPDRDRALLPVPVHRTCVEVRVNIAS